MTLTRIEELITAHIAGSYGVKSHMDEVTKSRYLKTAQDLAKFYKWPSIKVGIDVLRIQIKIESIEEDIRNKEKEIAKLKKKREHLYTDLDNGFDALKEAIANEPREENTEESEPSETAEG